ncbi:hypothetical protein SASPL_118395 [Salvia splendens]|uniref:AAA+ ATPase domain-containing protein n=1 Tax=Salvia splendens TaxID=180675 RepID=A0A8X8Y089_SALSN|nr:hypothetical protein SASPL_118395 [Salvia splendens]
MITVVSCQSRKPDDEQKGKGAKEDNGMRWRKLLFGVEQIGKGLQDNLSPKMKGDWKDLTLMSLSFAVYIYMSQKIVCAYCAWMSMAGQGQPCKGEAFYNKIGRAWKRGYHFHGPPGTGKSTMIAAMANLLGYYVYDLELTAVKDNTELKKLLIATSSRAVIVIKDINCSVDLTGQRVKRREDENEMKNIKITLSGLLNFIDGLWCACGGERIIVFTTNYVEKLDPTLIRRGRMDKHIELSYCSFEGFMVLAKNYVGVEWHELFPRIERLLGEVEMTPTDVAENLMSRSLAGDAEECLESVVRALEAKQKKLNATMMKTPLQRRRLMGSSSPEEKIDGMRFETEDSSVEPFMK